MIDSCKYVVEKYGDTSSIKNKSVFTVIDSLMNSINNIIDFDIEINSGFVIVNFSTDNITIYGSSSQFLIASSRYNVKVKSIPELPDSIFVTVIIDSYEV